MDQITTSQSQLSLGELVLRQEQLPKQEVPQDQLIAGTTIPGQKKNTRRSFFQRLSEARHTPTNIPVPSDINLEQCHKPRKERSGTGFGANSSEKKNSKISVRQKEEAPISFPAAQHPSYKAYLNEISIQRDDSITNNQILHIEKSATIKSNIEANRRLLWRTLVQDPKLEKLAQDTLVEYLNARPDDDKLIKFTFPTEEGSTSRITKELSLDSIQELKNDPDILMLVLLAKARTSPKEQITKELNLEDIIQIVDHMACISAWKNDSKEAKYPPDEPELRQILDFSIRSTQVQAQEPDEVFPEITTVLSPEILEEKQDSKGNTYEVVIPLEEMFKKSSIINPNNLGKIAEAFKNFSGLDLAKDKLLDIYSVPIDPGKPQWPNSSYIRTYLNNGALERIAYMEPRLSDTRRSNSVRAEGEGEDGAASAQNPSAVNHYISAVVDKNSAASQRAMPELKNAEDKEFLQDVVLPGTIILIRGRVTF